MQAITPSSIEPDPASSRWAKIVLGLALELVGELLDEPRAAERVGHVHDPGLLGDDLLGAQREPCGVLGRQGEGLVEGVGVQALGAAEHPGECLDGHADQVDLGLLGRERDPGRLGVEAQLCRASVRGPVALAHPAGPDAPSGAVLGDLLEEVDVGVEEEAEPRREVVDRQRPRPGPPRRRRSRWPA